MSSTSRASPHTATTSATQDNEAELLPGFRNGYARIHHDEQRHISYGVWYLREAARSRALADRIRQTLRELLPAVAAALTPPDGTDTALGASTGEIQAFALDGVRRRLKIVGAPLESL